MTATITLPAKSKFRQYKLKKSNPKDKRITKYATLWSKIFKKYGWATRSDADKKDLRHSIIKGVFGEYIKPSQFSATAWDIVFDALDTLEAEGILIWSKEMANYAIESGTRRRIIWLIRNVGFDRNSVQISGASQEYISSISSDKFGISDFETLELKQPEQLYWTVCSRATKKSAQGGTIAYNENQDNYVEADADDPF